MARYVIKWNERQNDAELVQQKKKKKKKWWKNGTEKKKKKKECFKKQCHQAKLKVK